MLNCAFIMHTFVNVHYNVMCNMCVTCYNVTFKIYTMTRVPVDISLMCMPVTAGSKAKR